MGKRKGPIGMFFPSVKVVQDKIDLTANRFISAQFAFLAHVSSQYLPCKDSEQRAKASSIQQNTVKCSITEYLKSLNWNITEFQRSLYCMELANQFFVKNLKYLTLHTGPDSIRFVQKLFSGLNGILVIAKEQLCNKKSKWRLLLYKRTKSSWICLINSKNY